MWISDRGQQPRPGRGHRRVDDEQERQADRRAREVDDGEAKERVAAMLDQRVPGRVQHRRAEDDAEDQEGQGAHRRAGWRLPPHRRSSSCHISRAGASLHPRRGERGCCEASGAGSAARGGRGVDHPPDLGDLVGREAAELRVAPDDALVRRHVHAERLVGSHVGTRPTAPRVRAAPGPRWTSWPRRAAGRARRCRCSAARAR